MKKLALLLLSLLAMEMTQGGCRKDPEIITKTIVETDTVLVYQTDTVVVHLTDTVTLQQYLQDTVTTFILCRHAETTGAGTDPDLSTEGLARAEKLQQLLAKVPLAAVYSTNYLRTTKTAQPTANDHGLSVQIYNPSALSALTDQVLSNYHGKAVLVTGHSNTTPGHLNLLTGTTQYATIPEAEYDNLYLVSVLEKGRATVVHLKY